MQRSLTNFDDKDLSFELKKFQSLVFRQLDLTDLERRLLVVLGDCKNHSVRELKDKFLNWEIDLIVVDLRVKGWDIVKLAEGSAKRLCFYKLLSRVRRWKS